MTPDSIRNIVFIGESGSGKTSLMEAILAKTGAVSRTGSVADGTSILDTDELEKDRQHSIDPALGYFEKDEVRVNLIDTPGRRDFMGNVLGPMKAVEAAVFVVDADEGVRPHTRKLWGIAENMGLAMFVVINRLDRESARFDEILEQLQSLSPKCSPLTVPVGVGADISGVERCIGEGKGSSDLVEAHSGSFLENVVETNEDLLEKYFGDEPISNEELDAQLAAAVRDRGIFPVLCTSVTKDLGVGQLIDTIVKYAPPASGVTAKEFDDPEQAVEVSPDPNGVLCGFVFRIVSDPFVGKLTLVRMYSGTILQNGQFINPVTGKTEKIGKIVRMQGKDQEAVESATAGDIVCLLKVEALGVFNTVCGSDKRLRIEPPKLPKPMYGRALEPKTRTDERKFSESLTKVTEEDPSIVAERDSRTNETVVSGLSQLHLQMIIERLKGRFNVEVTVKEPKVPYLETITVKSDAQYRHKKQTGGAGEFAEVWMRIEPLERGAGYEFANDVFGGSISESYVQSAEKGVKSVMEHGVIAGYPVVDVKVSVYDGKEHPVDSKDVAFQKAGREAFKLSVEKARPVILEPVVNLEVTFPADSVGDITGDLNRRRARVQGMDAEGDFQTLRAQIPLAELNEYSNTLGAMTGGQGTYEVEISHYEVAPGNVQQKIIEDSKAATAKKNE